ncbi:MAG: hypothetical protein C4524_07295 [Candidatus Zixiibacteriota bacterium]|nr:MAG: hypothetical protein C4524_07295 [candidate division Zixibacteria bacterium]
MLALGPALVFASTVALVGGSATPDGRALIMKLRDNSDNANQEYVYNNSGPYAYVGITYSGVTDQCWGGVNTAGFGINDSNAHNFNDPVPGPDDDGIIIRLALRTCATLEEFQAIMDSTNVTGRTRTANYGVVDSTGRGAFFEASAYSYTRYDLDDSTAAPHGFMVRANFAYSGGTYHLGQHRHDRAMALMDSAWAGGFLNHNFMTQVVQRDLVNEYIDPYPLPFQGREGLMPYGLMHSHDAINRDITRSGYVIQMAAPGEDPLLCTLWALVGEPIATAALPLWVKAGSVPVEFDGPNGSLLCQRAIQLTNYLYQRNVAGDALDTWRLVDERGQGWLPFLTALESQGFASGDSALAAWRMAGVPAPAAVAAFQNALAAYAYNQMNAWGPPAVPAVTLVRMPNNQVQVTWPPVTQDVFGRPLVVSGYTVFTSPEPFYDRFHGDSLTTVPSPPVMLPAADPERFYQVRARQ